MYSYIYILLDYILNLLIIRTEAGQMNVLNINIDNKFKKKVKLSFVTFSFFRCVKERDSNSLKVLFKERYISNLYSFLS